MALYATSRPSSCTLWKCQVRTCWADLGRCLFPQADLVSSFLAATDLQLLVLNFAASLRLGTALLAEGCKASIVVWEDEFVPLEQRIALVSSASSSGCRTGCSAPVALRSNIQCT